MLRHDGNQSQKLLGRIDERVVCDERRGKVEVMVRSLKALRFYTNFKPENFIRFKEKYFTL